MLVAIASLHSAVRHFSMYQTLLAIPTLALAILALLTLWAMFNGAYATYLPYLALGAALPLLLAQRLFAARAGRH